MREFEMLEEAANMSFSSQLSLFNDLPKYTLSAPRQPVADWTSRMCTRPEGRNKPGCHSSSSSDDQTKPNVAHSPGQSKSTHLQAVTDDEDTTTDHEDLDETLKFSPSLAKGVEFNDEEAWESFSHGSPRYHLRTGSSGSDTTLPHSSPSDKGEVWNSPVKKEVLAKNVGFKASFQTVLDGMQSDSSSGIGVGSEQGMGEGKQHVTTIEKVRVVEPSTVVSASTLASSSMPNGRSVLPESWEFSDCNHHSDPASDGVESFQNPMPPPSALVSKLFPVLRQVEEQPKRLLPGHHHHHQPKPCHSSESHASSTKSTSPVSSMEGDSGIRSLSSTTSVGLSEDLKYKLNQLEEEIARYRAENSSLERLRKERENVSLCLGSLILRQLTSSVFSNLFYIGKGCCSFAARNC